MRFRCFDDGRSRKLSLREVRDVGFVCSRLAFDSRLALREAVVLDEREVELC